MSLNNSIINMESLKAVCSSALDSVSETLRALIGELPSSFVIVPFGQVQTDTFLFSLVYIVLGILYISLSLRHRTRQSIAHATTRRKVVVHCSPSESANTFSSRQRKVSHVQDFDATTVGGFKEEVYEFMETCADVKKSLRKVEDPDKARAMKLKQLKEHEGAGTGTGAGTDREDSSHNNELVDMCLDVKKGLHKVPDPDEVRKAKLRHLKEVETSKSKNEIAQQHQQVGLVRSWVR